MQIFILNGCMKSVHVFRFARKVFLNRLQKSECLCLDFFLILFHVIETPVLRVTFHTNKALWLKKKSRINYYKAEQEKLEWWTLTLSDTVKLSGSISVCQVVHQIRFYTEED